MVSDTQKGRKATVRWEIDNASIKPIFSWNVFLNIFWCYRLVSNGETGWSGSEISLSPKYQRRRGTYCMMPIVHWAILGPALVSPSWPDGTQKGIRDVGLQQPISIPMFTFLATIQWKIPSKGSQLSSFKCSTTLLPRTDCSPPSNLMREFSADKYSPCSTLPKSPTLRATSLGMSAR